MADRLRLIEGVRHLLADDMTALATPEDVKHCELLVKTNAGFAFFSVVDPVADIVEVWKEAQDEIASYLRRLSLTQDRPGAYLALLVEGDRSKDAVSMQKIAANPFVCRKILIPGVTEGNLREKVSQLPFFPLPNELQQALGPLSPDPAVVLTGTGLSERIIDQLLSRTGIDSIKVDLLEGKFDGGGGAAPSGELSPPRPEHEFQNKPRLKVRKLHLRNFRNFGPEFKPLVLEGDLILIHGRNGTGKSSICEALEWGITGQSQRVFNNTTDEGIENQDPRSPLVNLRSGTDEATVDVWLEGAEQVHITRAITATDRVSVRLNGRRSNDREVLSKYSQVDEDTSVRVDQNLRSATQGCHFLSQDTILDFLRNDPAARYRQYSFIAGTHQVAVASRKTQRLLDLLAADAEKHNTAIAALAQQLADAETERQSVAENLPTPGLEQHDASVLVKKGLGLVQKATLMGVKLEMPPTTGIRWAQSMTETLLTLAPQRLNVLYERIRNLERLHRETERIAALRREIPLLEAERSQLATKETALAELTDHLERRPADIRQAIDDRHADLVEADAYRAKVAQLLVVHERHERLHVDLTQAEESRMALEANASAQGARLAELRASRTRAVESVRALTEREQWIGDVLQALRHALADLPGRTAMQERLDVARTEAASVSALEHQQAEVVSQLQADLDAAQHTVNRQEAVLTELREFVGRRQALLAELKAQTRANEDACPVCGTRHGHDELMARMEATLAILPEGLETATEAIQLAQAEWSRVKQSLVLGTGELARVTARRSRLLADITSLEKELAEQSLAFRDLFPAYGTIWMDAERLNDAIRQHQLTREDLHKKLVLAHTALETANSQVLEVEVKWQAAVQAAQDVKHRIDQLRSDEQANEAAAQGLALPPFSQAETVNVLRQQQAKITELGDELRQVEAELADYERQLQEALAARNRLADALAAADQRLKGVVDEVHAYESDLRAEGIVSVEPARQVENVTAALADRRIFATEMAELIPALELFLTEINMYRIQTEVSQLDRRIESLDKQRDTAQKEYEQIQKRVAQLSAISTNLQKSKAEQDSERLRGIEPLALHLCQRLNAHPFFGGLDLEVNSGAQELYVRFKPEAGSELTAEVNRYYSAAQSIGVALSIFMGTALLQSWTDVGLICMDDPVQHLDDMNVYALLDVVHTLVSHGRQVVFTTASEELYKLMLWRFAMLNAPDTPRQFQAFRLIGITETGPEIKDDTPKARRASMDSAVS